MNSLTNMLFAELLVGAILFKSSDWLTISAIKSISACNSYPDEYINQIIKDLIAYGLVAPHFHGATKFAFHITDFGKYYYNKLAKENSDIGQLIERIGGELK